MTTIIVNLLSAEITGTVEYLIEIVFNNYGKISWNNVTQRNVGSFSLMLAK